MAGNGSPDISTGPEGAVAVAELVLLLRANTSGAERASGEPTGDAREAEEAGLSRGEMNCSAVEFSESTAAAEGETAESVTRWRLAGRAGSAAEALVLGCEDAGASKSEAGRLEVCVADEAALGSAAQS
jgi:hypothetical protein